MVQKSPSFEPLTFSNKGAGRSFSYTRRVMAAAPRLESTSRVILTISPFWALQRRIGTQIVGQLQRTCWLVTCAGWSIRRNLSCMVVYEMLQIMKDRSARVTSRCLPESIESHWYDSNKWWVVIAFVSSASGDCRNSSCHHHGRTLQRRRPTVEIRRTLLCGLY